MATELIADASQLRLISLYAQRSDKLQLCATTFGNRSPSPNAVPSRGSGSPNQLRAASRNSSADEEPPAMKSSLQKPIAISSASFTSSRPERLMRFSSVPPLYKLHRVKVSDRSCLGGRQWKTEATFG